MLLFLLLLCHDTQRMKKKSAGWLPVFTWQNEGKKIRRLSTTTPCIAQTIRDLYNRLCTAYK